MPPAPLPRVQLTVFVKDLTGRADDYVVELDDTVLSVKYKMQDLRGIPPDMPRLIFAGQQLDDRRTLRSYRITEGSVLHNVLHLRGC